MMKRERRRGYSLLEVMMVVTILGIVSSVGARLLLQANRYFIFTQAKADLQRQARAAMYVITSQLRQAQASTIVIDQAAGQPYYSRVTFTPLGAATSISIEQNGTKLMQLAGTCLAASCQHILATHLLYLAITFSESDNMSIVSVSMTLQENTYQGHTKALHMASEQVQVMN